jgi:hypothetical protein
MDKNNNNNNYIIIKIERMLENIKSEEVQNLYKNFKSLHSNTSKWIIK